jgi:DNA adenine methylase
MLFDTLFSNDLEPIIKWAGGKEKELKYIHPNAPERFNDYYEPFVGGGSVYASFIAKHYYINDKSSELISLYRSIKAQDKVFYDWTDKITTAWDSMLSYMANHKELISTYDSYRHDEISDSTLKSIIATHLEEHSGELNKVIPAKLSWHRDIYFDELRINLSRKIMRMKKIEREKNILPDSDVYDNIETAFMSALYMYFRALYNDFSLMEKEPAFATAVFLFIRNYSYSGMFRYNDDGEFNVPYGGIAYNHKRMNAKLDYYRSPELLEHFADTTIENLDFEEFFSLHKPKKGDFVFLDPPYDSEFSTYANNAFTKDDQSRLANYLCDKCSAYWMMVIKYTPFIYSLYADKGLKISTFDKQYLVSFMNRNDKNAEHLIITNY